MFRYSIDPLIFSKQKEEADNLLVEMKKHGDFQFSTEIEALFEKVTFDYLEEFVRLVREEMKEKIIIVAIPRQHGALLAKMDLDIGYTKSGRQQWDLIPYIEHSYPEDYVCPHGENWMHCYFFFFTQYSEFKDAEKCVTKYLSRLNRLKAFL